MAKLRIEGGRRLSGRITVEGNKNSALPLMAACLLTERECVLTNVPRIRDVDVLAELMTRLGASIEGRGTSTLRITCARVTSDTPDPAAGWPAARLGPAARPAARPVRLGAPRATRG